MSWEAPHDSIRTYPRRCHRGALSWAHTPDRSARTAPARAALDRKFLDAAGGDPVRAAHLRKAHFQRLALKSAQSRRKIKEATAVAETVEAELSAGGGPDAA